MNIQERFSEQILRLFKLVTSIVFAVILLFLTIGITIGVAKLFLQVGGLLSTGNITGTYQVIITDVLSLFILIELSRSLVEYFDSNRLRLTFIIDAGIVFVLREIMIQLFKHSLGPQEIYALSALLLVLGALRIASTMAHPRDQTLQDSSAG